jgi:hypothetical protein
VTTIDSWARPSRVEGRGGRPKAGLPEKISAHQKSMRPIRAQTLPTYERANYAICVPERKLSDEIPAKLAEESSNTIVTMSQGMAICEY